MKQRQMILDGKVMLAEDAALEKLSPWALKGRGVFETMRSYHGRVFQLKEHLARLLRGLESLKIREITYTSAKLKGLLYSSLRSNKLNNARIRMTVWRDKQKKIRLSIISRPYRSRPEDFKNGYRVFLSRQKWIIPGSHGIKSIDYWPYLRAYHTAKARGYDEAVLMNVDGFLAEGTRSNLFVVKNKRIYTPPLASGCLDGVTRRVVIKLARSLRIPCQEKNLLPGDLAGADEAFLTNSLIELVALTSVGSKPVGNGRIGPVTRKLQVAYRALVVRSR